MKKFIKDKRAGASAIVFILLLMLSIFTLMKVIPIIQVMYTRWAITMTYKKGLDKVQQTGVLTNEIEAQIKNYAANFGIDKTKMVINGTLTPVNWGEDVGISIDYNLTYKDYTLPSILLLNVSDKTVDIHVEGSTSSYYFDNNN